MAQTREREGEARIVVVLVVDEERGLADVGDLDDAELSVGAHHDTPLVVGAEPDRLAVHEGDQHRRSGSP